MCKNLCERFDSDYFGVNHYCQECAKFINKKYLKKEKRKFGRLRCTCCNGLVRTKPKKIHIRKVLQIK
jgi:hypothetical protein|tara:strand:- start:2196 stop:2399 length:204 start_codon:yes stop_codon:yes gene_type:complete